MRLLPAIAVTVCALSLAACASTGGGHASGGQPAARTAANEGHSRGAAIRELLEPRIAAGTVPDPVTVFYEARKFEPAWSGDKEREEIAREARALLARADEQGLRAGDYEFENDCSGLSGADSANCDIALTARVLRYAHDVRIGRVQPDSVYEDVDLPAPQFDAAAELNRAMASHAVMDWLTALPPSHPEYLQLVQALAKYRGILGQGGWPTLPAGLEIKPTGKDSRTNLLVRRLAFEDPVLASIPQPSGAQIRDALKRFQLRNGLGVDGRIGKGTLAALNVPASARIAQIAANMERWRWLPAQFEDRFIAVNVPDLGLAFIQDGNAVLSSRVVVGRKTSPTPILRTTVTAAVVNPPWNIPGDIAARALLPHLRQDHRYLASRHMVVMDGPPGDPLGLTIDWRKIVADDFPYAIRQLPGPDTALGALMLDSPNKFDVYLHDTPSKSLFGLDQREISNGCVRVQQIIPLAALALGDDAAPDESQLAAAMKTHDTQRLALDRPLPVYFLYWTAFTDADGNVQFRQDPYGRDAPLIAALANDDRGDEAA